MKILKELILESTELLEQNHIDNPRRQAEDVIADALQMKRLDLYLQFDRPLNEQELNKCRESIQRRSLGEPAQYIQGAVEFFDCKFQVGPEALIPRNETEILVEKVCAYLRSIDRSGKILWDLCCGSGCIGIAIKKKFPELEVVLSDLSPLALKLARKNALLNEVDVTFVEGDLLDPFEGMKCDFVVCNPPYISSKEYIDLDREVREHEPKMALVAENDGLAFYQRLAKELPHYLNPRGKAWFEIGYNQGNSLLDLFQSPPWTVFYVENDWSKKNRFFFLEIE